MNVHAIAILAGFTAAAWVGHRFRLAGIRLVAVVVAPWLLAIAMIADYRRGVLVLQALLNPDEAQFLATAMKIVDGGWRPWIDIDPGTVGFLVPGALVPGLVIAPGAPYLVARVVAVLCIGLMALGLALSLRRLVGWLPAQLAASPLLLLAVVPAYVDLYSYSSELVPLALALVGIGMAIDASAGGRVARGRFVVGFVLVGLVVFAKLQVVPVAAAWALAVVVTTAMRSPRSRRGEVVALAISGGLLPVIALGAFLFVSPDLRRALAASLEFIQRYAGAGSDPGESLAQFLAAPAAGFILLAGLGAAFVALALIAASMRVRSLHNATAPLGLALASPVGLYAMAAPGRYFPHYLWVALVPGLVAIVVVGVILLRGWVGAGRNVVLGAAAMVMLALIVFGAGRPLTTVVTEPDGFVEEGWSLTRLGTDEQLGVVRALELCVEAEIPVWGWDPGVLVVAERPHWSPAAALLAPDDPVAQAWLGRLVDARPECVVDASGPEQFAFSGDWARLDRQSVASLFLQDYESIFSSRNYRVYRLRSG